MELNRPSKFPGICGLVRIQVVKNIWLNSQLILRPGKGSIPRSLAAFYLTVGDRWGLHKWLWKNVQTVTSVYYWHHDTLSGWFILWQLRKNLFPFCPSSKITSRGVYVWVCNNSATHVVLKLLLLSTKHNCCTSSNTTILSSHPLTTKDLIFIVDSSNSSDHACARYLLISFPCPSE